MDINQLPKDTPIITTKYVTENKSQVVYVSYDDEGDFQMFSNEGADMEKVAIVSLNEILNIQPNLTLLIDIQRGDKYYREENRETWQKI
ncbi:MAG: hypothetical protein ACK5IC_09970 [Moheibacter sp.]